MFRQSVLKSYRLLAAFLALAMLVMALPRGAAAAAGIRINIVSVKKNDSVVVEAVNFPKNQTWKVRIGPYYTFSKDAVTVETFKSTEGGTFRFTVKLPSVVKDVDLIAIRLDSDQKYYAYNAFSNKDSGSSDATTDPKPTPVPTETTLSCTLVSVAPTRANSMPTRNDFDAVWEVKNTGSKNWESSGVDYKYVSGEKIHKRGSAYDLPTTVKPGEKLTIRVDMLAPSTAGTYTTNWALVEGSRTLCSLPLTITVR